MSRRHDSRRIRTAHGYPVAEIAALFRVRPATVRGWISHEGLEIVPGCWPPLVHGGVLREFIQRKNKPRQPTGPGELYCAPCKRPQRPLGGVAALVPRSPTTADLVGRCSRCGRFNYQRVTISRVAEKVGHLRLVNEDVIETLVGAPATPHNRHLKVVMPCSA